MFNCLCRHVDKVAVQDLMLKYGGDTTIAAVEKVVRGSRCRGKNITSTQIIHVGNIKTSMYILHTSIDYKDF